MSSAANHRLGCGNTLGVEEAAELCMSIVKLLLGLYTQLGVAQSVWGLNKQSLPNTEVIRSHVGGRFETQRTRKSCVAMAKSP